MVTDEIFADTIGRVDFANGLVRIELASVEPAESSGTAGSGVVLKARKRLIMPLEGFLHTFATMGELLGKLEAAGVIRRQETPAAGTTPPASATPAVVGQPSQPGPTVAATRTGRLSPNFARDR